MTEPNILQIAQICYESLRAYNETLDRCRRLPWEDAAAWCQKAATEGVRFLAEHPGAGPEESHKAWMSEKTKDGWVYGPERDFDRKTHPSLIPFDQLSPSHQREDLLFVAVFRALTSDLPKGDSTDDQQ